MGRLKNKDRIPEVSVDARKSTRVAFSDSDDSDDENAANEVAPRATRGKKAQVKEMAPVNEKTKNNQKNKNNNKKKEEEAPVSGGDDDDDDDDAPEEMSKFDSELEKLKALHEASQSVSAKDRKMKAREARAAEEKALLAARADEPLDPAVLAAMAGGGSDSDSDEDADEDEEQQGGEENVFRIDINKKAAKIFDNIEVEVLDDVNPQDNFTVSAEVAAFLGDEAARHTRVNYSAFSRAKTSRPAAQFANKDATAKKKGAKKGAKKSARKGAKK
jgi:hypothetical protein